MTLDALDTILNHRSYRSFESEPLNFETEKLLLDAAQHGSSSTFSQQYSIIVVSDPEKKQKIADLTHKTLINSSASLFILLVDQHRNAQISKAKGEKIEALRQWNAFLAGVDDAVIAGENMIVAAESMGLGGVFLGSILNDPKQMVQLLDLPELTFPLLGLAIGHPKQTDKPDLKPRMPQTLMAFNNSYPSDQDILAQFTTYDHTLSDYYAHRDSNQRHETFTHMIAQQQLTAHHDHRDEIGEVLKMQGFQLD